MDTLEVAKAKKKFNQLKSIFFKFHGQRRALELVIYKIALISGGRNGILIYNVRILSNIVIVEAKHLR